MKEETILNVEVAEGSEQPVEYKKSEKVAGRRIGYNYIIVKSLKESGKNDVVKCFYIKSLTKWGFCVIKEGTYGDTKDIEGRDIKDRLMWQKEVHEAVQGKVRIPKLIGSFEENGNYYLVMEYLRGKALGVLIKEQKHDFKEFRDGTSGARKRLGYILQILDLLQRLHGMGYVHRDVTITNFVVVRSGKMYLIDMELAYSLKQSQPTPPFRLGTNGYMSPQQLAIQKPTEKEDIYAVGALIFQIMTGFSAVKISGGADEDLLLRRVNYLVEDAGMGDLILRCLSADPELRPGLSDIKSTVTAYAADMKNGLKRTMSKRRLFSKDEIRETLQKGINSLSTTLFADPEKGWFADSGNKASQNGQVDKTWQASLNAGASGILYFLSEAKELGYDVSANQHLVELSLNLIKQKYIQQKRDATGLFFGSDGIAVALERAIKSGLLADDPVYTKWIEKLLRSETRHLGIVPGLAGQGIANLRCSAMLPDEVCRNRTKRYVEKLNAMQQPEGWWAFKKTNGKLYAEHDLNYGAAGIACFLLEYARKYDLKDVLDDAIRGLDWLAKTAKGKEEFQWFSDRKRGLGYSLGNGNAGIAVVFLKAYEITREERFATYARRTLAISNKELLWNNLTLLNGCSGLGIAYLEAFRILGDMEWYERASSIAQTIMHLQRQGNDGNVFWLLAHELKPTAGMMIGNSGLQYFLLKYVEQERAMTGTLFF